MHSQQFDGYPPPTFSYHHFPPDFTQRPAAGNFATSRVWLIPQFAQVLASRPVATVVGSCTRTHSPHACPVGFTVLDLVCPHFEQLEALTPSAVQVGRFVTV